MPRIVCPPVEDLAKLRQPLTTGEEMVLDYFLKYLPEGWEIYIQPHLNGLCPDFVLLHPKRGIAVYEVKDWNLGAMSYFHEKRGSDAPVLMANDGIRSFSVEKQNPVTKIDLYKSEIYDLYCPRLPPKTGFGSIVAGVIFPFAHSRDVTDLLAPFREHYKQSKYPNLYPLFGRDRLESDKHWTLKQLLPSAYEADHRMSEAIAGDLRHWLVEPTYISDQRKPLVDLLAPKQRDLCFNKSGVAYRRVRGPAGSGKSMILAGRAAQLAAEGKRVLVVTFNITLINYLLDLAVRFAQSGKVRKQIEALNFHLWCKRVAQASGHLDAYNALWADNDVKEVLDQGLAIAARGWLDDLDESERWDALLLDEGQDFDLSWWTTLRAGLRREGKVEALLCADKVQNIYDVTPWTEEQMPGAGFRGKWISLEESFRMSPSLCLLAKAFVDRFLPALDGLRPIPPAGEFEFKTVLKWWQVPVNEAAQACVDALIQMVDQSDPPMAYADLVCVVDSAKVGIQIVEALDAKGIKSVDTFGRGDSELEREMDSRRRKLHFYQGAGKVKITTIQSYKGWESRALVLHISQASSGSAMALAYAGITRLKKDDFGCYLTVVSSAGELAAYGQTWPSPEHRPGAANPAA